MHSINFPISLFSVSFRGSRNEKRMHFDGSNFIVRNAGHSAGFNENNLLIVY